MAALCDHACVGVVIPDAGDTYWLLDRGKPPPGWAFAAGHVDDHGDPKTAARVEAREEMGLTVVSLIPALEEWFPNWCRRQPQSQEPSYDWRIFIAEWEGGPVPSPDEARDLRRFHRWQLQALAERTAAYAVGDLTPEEFVADPGLELPWAYWAHRLNLVDLPRDALAASPTDPPGRRGCSTRDLERWMPGVEAEDRPPSQGAEAWPCPGLAPQPPCPADSRRLLTWTTDKPAQYRTLEYTCACQPTAYEFLACGGNYRIRRTERTEPPRESYAGPWRRQTADRIWALLLVGEVCLCS